MILAKSCHDLDIILWLAGSDCKRLSSFGTLTHFKAENAPEGAPKCAFRDARQKVNVLIMHPKLYDKEHRLACLCYYQ